MSSRRNEDDASSSDEELLTSLHDDISVDGDLLDSLLADKVEKKPTSAPADKKTEESVDLGDDFEIDIEKSRLDKAADDDASDDEELLTSALDISVDEPSVLDISIDEGEPEKEKEEEERPPSPKKVASLKPPERKEEEQPPTPKKVPSLMPPSRNNLSDDEDERAGGKPPLSATPPPRVNVDDASASSGNLISPGGSSTAGSQSGTFSPRSGSLSSSNSAGGNREKIRKDVEDLVKRVAPEDINNVDEMMKQFKGREDELLESLRSMQERKVVQKSRAQGQKQAKIEAKKTARKKSNLAQERMASIKAQQDAFAKKGKSSPAKTKLKTVGKGTLAAQRMAAIKAQQEAFAKKGRKSSKDTVAPTGGNLAAERMASIKAQQAAFAQKRTPTRNTEVGKGNVAAQRMASIKAQQEAFAKKGTPSRESKPKVGRGNVAAAAMASIQAKQVAFAKKGTKTDDEKSTDSGELLVDDSEKASASPEKSNDGQKNVDDGITSPHKADDGATSPHKADDGETSPQKGVVRKISATPPRRDVSARNIETDTSAKSAAPPSRLNMSITAASAAVVGAAVVGAAVATNLEEDPETEITSPPSASHHSHSEGDDGITSTAAPSRLDVSIREESTQDSGQSTAPPSRVDVSIRNESPEDILLKNKALSILPEGDVEEDAEEDLEVQEPQTPPEISRAIDEDVERGFEDKTKNDENKSWCRRNRNLVAWLFILGALAIILGFIFWPDPPSDPPSVVSEKIEVVDPFDLVASGLGEGFDGQEDIQLGESLDLSLNGDYLIIGSNEINSRSSAGQAKVVKYNDINGTWDQVGDIIPGAQGGNFGISAQINEDGTFVIVGGSGSNDAAIDHSGTVCAYEYDGNEWKKFGNEIQSEYKGDRFGVSLSMANDGSSWIVGADKYRNPATNNLDGYAKVYELQGGGEWAQKGNTFFGSEESRTGASVAMSGDGNTVCIGDRWYKIPESAIQKGRARCFEWDGGNWTKKGDDIIGRSAAANGQMGSSISLSNDGNRVAVGDLSGGDQEQGSASVFEIIDGKWERMGAELISADRQDRGGLNVKLSSKGDVLAWTAELHSMERGAVIISGWNNTDWIEVDRVFGTNETDYYGRSVALSANGTRFAASAHGGTVDYVNAYEMIVPP